MRERERMKRIFMEQRIKERFAEGDDRSQSEFGS
jgi:hypothetical protein